MSSALLAKLMVKPVPQVRESVIVALPVPATQETVPIKAVDRRAEAKIDRREILSRIGKIVAKPVVPQEVSETKRSEAPPKKTKKHKKRLKLVEGSKSATTAIVPRAKSVVKEAPSALLLIGDEILQNRVPQRDANIVVRSSSYYMNNRKIFINFINSLFLPYQRELTNEESAPTCGEKKGDNFMPMTHQKIIRDYINLYTPYRGIVLYHGLGAGKTCSSIITCEAMKTSKPIIVMTPASLQMNYVEELKHCGDSLYRKNQYWEFINTSKNSELLPALSYALSLPVEFIQRQRGAWLVNIQKPSNFDSLNSAQRISLDKQIDAMIRNKYKFINYNGLRLQKLRNMTANFTNNIFDNSVVVIDEAHNFVSRIVNKMGRPESLSMRLYEYLMSAKNTRIILLTGTPIINYPNEIGIIFNILRGRIYTWHFKLTVNTQRSITQDAIKNMFIADRKTRDYFDFIHYSSTNTTLSITRNPFGFRSKREGNKYEGVEGGDNLSDDEFIADVTRVLGQNSIRIASGGTRVDTYKALPDTLEEFKNMFIDGENNLKNENLLKRRIMGLTSYFKDIEQLMPRYDKSHRGEGGFNVIRIEMSDFQFGVYEEARAEERKLELANAKKRKRAKTAEDLYEIVSTYRIFSRAFCNFVFPRPHIRRPFPNEGEDIETAILKETADEDLLDAASVSEKLDNVDGKYEADEADAIASVDAQRTDESYLDRIKHALEAARSE